MYLGSHATGLDLGIPASNQTTADNVRYVHAQNRDRISSARTALGGVVDQFNAGIAQGKSVQQAAEAALMPVASKLLEANADLKTALGVRYAAGMQVANDTEKGFIAAQTMRGANPAASYPYPADLAASYAATNDKVELGTSWGTKAVYSGATIQQIANDPQVQNGLNRLAAKPEYAAAVQSYRTLSETFNRGGSYRLSDLNTVARFVLGDGAADALAMGQDALDTEKLANGVKISTNDVLGGTLLASFDKMAGEVGNNGALTRPSLDSVVATLGRVQADVRAANPKPVNSSLGKDMNASGIYATSAISNTGALSDNPDIAAAQKDSTAITNAATNQVMADSEASAVHQLALAEGSPSGKKIVPYVPPIEVNGEMVEPGSIDEVKAHAEQAINSVSASLDQVESMLAGAGLGAVAGGGGYAAVRGMIDNYKQTVLDNPKITMKGIDHGLQKIVEAGRKAVVDGYASRMGKATPVQKIIIGVGVEKVVSSIIAATATAGAVAMGEEFIKANATIGVELALAAKVGGTVLATEAARTLGAGTAASKLATSFVAFNGMVGVAGAAQSYNNVKAAYDKGGITTVSMADVLGVMSGVAGGMGAAILTARAWPTPAPVKLAAIAAGAAGTITGVQGVTKNDWDLIPGAIAGVVLLAPLLGLSAMEAAGLVVASSIYDAAKLFLTGQALSEAGKNPITGFPQQTPPDKQVSEYIAALNHEPNNGEARYGGNVESPFPSPLNGQEFVNGTPFSNFTYVDHAWESDNRDTFNQIVPGYYPQAEHSVGNGHGVYIVVTTLPPVYDKAGKEVWPERRVTISYEGTLEPKDGEYVLGTPARPPSAQDLLNISHFYGVTAQYDGHQIYSAEVPNEPAPPKNK